MRLRHRRGRGLLLDDAEANRSTYLSKDSTASGFSKLRDCELYSSNATGRSQIYGGKYWRSTIGGQTICAGHPTVCDSILLCSEVSGTPTLDRVHATGNTEICDSPQLIGTADDYFRAQNAIIYGNPIIQGAFTVTGRVHEGTWTRAPKHVKLPWCHLSECINGKVILDCWCRPAEWWLRFGPQKAREKWEWSEDQIWVTLETIRREFLIA